MNDIFANAKNILVIWIDDTDAENLPTFQKILQTKANQAHIAFENVDMLLECKFDLSK
jgi:arylamine N-acetyltransferase